jgi:hypothetical protein
MAEYKSLKLGCLALALAGLVAMLGTFTAAASADLYGELPTTFGNKAHEATGIEPGQINYEGSHAVGVDPTDDSTYIGDELEPEIKAGKELKRFRIQKFSASGQFLASSSFRLSALSRSLVGVAVDPKLGHVYALVVDEREKPLDNGTAAAGALYAFSTTPKGQELESLGLGSEPGKPLPLVPETALKPQGGKAREALLKPGGIAVDPSNDDVVIVGTQDEGSEEFVATLLRIHSSGVLGNRSVDSTNCLLEGSTSGGEPHCAEANGEPVAPVVTKGGKVYVEVQGTDQVWQIPTPETKQLRPGEFETVPKQLLGLTQPKVGAHLLAFTESGEGEESRGDGLSLAPEAGTAGKLYVDSEIQQDEEEKGELKSGGSGFTYPGVIAFKYSENSEGVLEAASEEGWTGGPATGAKCQIEAPGGVTALLAGSKEKDVFVFAFGAGKEASPPVARVSEFGPGGEGCPHARLTNSGVAGIKATANTVEKPVFSPKDEVILSSEIFEANALSVKWEIENVATHTKEEHLTGEEFQTPALPPHKFAEGEYKVRETINTDGLASPEIKAERLFKVEGRPSAGIRGRESLTLGESDALEGRLTNPIGGSLQYLWKFGDGGESSGSTSAETVSGAHTYQNPGTYTVTLKVTDSEGHSGEATFHVQVKEPESAPPPTTTSTTPPATTSTATTTPPPSGGGGGGVQAYSASFAGNAFAVNARGALVIKVDCVGPSSCSGTVTLRTVNAVSAGAHKRKAVLTLASGSFSAVGGHVAAVTLHLSAKARALLARSHVLRVRATIVGHDSAGKAHTTQTTITLRAAAAKHKR